MDRVAAFVLSLILLAGCIVPGPDGITPGGNTAWTIMVYLDSDNNLEPAAIMDLDEMERVGSSDNVKIIVQWDRVPGYDSSNGDWEGTKRFLVTTDAQEGVIASQELMDLGEVDMADAASLADFITWGMQNYPAERYALFLWNHGGGWAVHTQDETNETQANLLTLKEAFESAGLGNGKKLDLLVFDQCLMGQIDVAYAVAPYAKAMVASEDVIPFFSVDYGGFLSELQQNPAMDEKRFSTAIVQSYETLYTKKQPNPFTTLTALDLGKMPGISSAFTEFVSALQNNAQQQWPKIGESLLFSESFATPEGIAVVKSFSAYDLADFADITRQNVDVQEIKDASANLKAAIQDAVIAEYHGTEHPYATGLTVYFPEDEIIYSQAYSGASALAKETGWDDFVREYISLEKTDLIAPSLVIESVSSTTVSMNNPINIQGTATGNNLASIFRLVGKVQENKIYILNSHPLIQTYKDYEGERKLPQFFDGANNIDYTWTPMAEIITNGQQQVIAPLQSFGKGDYYFAAQGEYLQKSGQQPFNAMLVFDYRYGTLLGALEIGESNGNAFQKEFVVQPGDTFTPYVEFYDMQTGKYGLAKTDSITVSEQGLGIDLFLLPEGQYTIGLFVSDITGNMVTDVATVNVAGQPEPNPGISANDLAGNWIGDGLGFEIFADGSCVSTVGIKKADCTYWFRNNGLPLISFYIQAGDEIIFVAFMVDASGNKLTLTEMFEGKKYVLWKEGTTPEPEPAGIDGALVGKWVNPQGSVEFRENGTYAWEIAGNVSAGTFSAESGSLSMTSQGKTTQYSYSVSGSNLSITDPQGSKLAYTKSTGTVQPATNTLVGSWYNAPVNETATFNADGTYNSYISGNLFSYGTYSISGNTLVLNAQYGTWAYAFAISGNVLTLYDPVYGTYVSYVKVG